MNKSIFRKIVICTMFIILFSTLFFLPKTNASTIGEIFSTGKGFIEAGNDIDKTIDTTALADTSDFLYNTLLAIGIVIAVIVAMVLGIQFMWASAEEKAKVKEAMLPFVVGCFVVFGAFTIWKLAVNIGNDAEEQVTSISIIEADEEMQETRTENSELLARVENGEIDKLTNKELERLYTTNYIDTDLRGWTDEPDPRAGRKRCTIYYGRSDTKIESS